MRQTLLVSLLVAVALTTGCSSPSDVGALSDPLSGTSALDSAVAAGLADEIKFLGTLEGTERPAGYESAQAGTPLPVWQPLFHVRTDSLRKRFGGNPIYYVVPVLVDGDVVSEFFVGVTDSGQPDPEGFICASNGAGYGLYSRAIPKVKAVLGDNATIVLTPRPTMAVLGWSPRGEALMVVSIEDTYVNGHVGSLLRGGAAVDLASRLW